MLAKVVDTLVSDSIPMIEDHPSIFGDGKYHRVS